MRRTPPPRPGRGVAEQGYPATTGRYARIELPPAQAPDPDSDPAAAVHALGYTVQFPMFGAPGTISEVMSTTRVRLLARV